MLTAFTYTQNNQQLAVCSKYPLFVEITCLQRSLHGLFTWWVAICIWPANEDMLINTSANLIFHVDGP